MADYKKQSFSDFGWFPFYDIAEEYRQELNAIREKRACEVIRMIDPKEMERLLCEPETREE